MSKRAVEAFVIALIPKGKRNFSKDEIVPDDLAKRAGGLVYDDGSTTVVKKKGAAVPR